MKLITINLRPVFSILGIFLTGLSVTMLIPPIVDLIYGNNEWSDFVFSALITAFVGLLLILVSRGGEKELTTKGAFLLVTLSWIVLSIFSSVPFLISQSVQLILKFF